MSSVANQFAAGIGQAMASLGVRSTYTRASDGKSLDLVVALAEPEYPVEQGDGMILAAEAWEILFIARELMIDGAMYEPQLGDTVTTIHHGETRVYAALLPGNRKFCWA